MNKKLYAILIAFAIACSAFYACGDDDNDTKVDEVWKAFNDSIYEATAKNTEFSRRTCLSRNGDIYYKSINEFNITPPPSTKITADGTPHFSDSVTVRYEGWFYYKDINGKTQKYIFDGTEGDYNKQNGVGFQVKKLTSGFATMLQYMKVNDQVQICVPHKLAYGPYDNNTTKMRGYTTLFFNIMLLKIHPLNPNEFPEVKIGQ